MSRSHPPSLLRLVHGTLERECDLGPKAKILLGVSGGPDSLALLHCLSLLRPKLNFSLIVLCVDHGLRPEAELEVRSVEHFCKDHEVPFFTQNLGLSPGANLQERARDARYQALFRVADEQGGESALVATAHHREDRAETVLMRLLRGTSLEGLGVLKPREGRLVRPMIRAGRSAVLEHVARHGLTPAQDPSNHDSKYLRVRVRKELLPLLFDLGPGIVSHLCDLSDEAYLLPEPLGLNREQRLQLRYALKHPDEAVDLRFAHGLVLSRPARKKGQD